MNVFGIGLPELAVIAAIGLLVFGPKRLPELGKTLGKTLKGFQSASSEFEREFRSAVSAAETPASQPVDPETVDAGIAIPDNTAPPFAPADAQLPLTPPPSRPTSVETAMGDIPQG